MIRLPSGGSKAKATNLAKPGFVPSGYLSLGDGVAAAGKALFGDSWTGDERTCRYEDNNYRKRRDRRTAIQERRLALFQEHSGRDWQDELDDDLPILGEEDLASIESELAEKWAARQDAGQRFEQTVGWVQDRLLSGVIPAVVLTASGTTYPMPTQIWGSDGTPAIFKFGKVEFHPAKYGWNWSPTAAPLKGRVLIKREHIVRALSGEDTPPQETPEPAAAGGEAAKRRSSFAYEGVILICEEVKKPRLTRTRLHNPPTRIQTKNLRRGDLRDQVPMLPWTHHWSEKCGD